MTPFERWSNHASNLLVGGTGVVYAVMRYLMKPDDPFAIVNHPLQPAVQHLHILFAPLLVFAVGLVWLRHVAPRLLKRQHPRRVTGIGLAVLVVPMIVSGSLVQTAVDDDWRKIWGIVHLVASLIWLLAYGVHLLSPQAAARKALAARRPAHRPPTALD